MLTRKDAIKIESLKRLKRIKVPKDTPLKQSLGLPCNLGVYKL